MTFEQLLRRVEELKAKAAASRLTQPETYQATTTFLPLLAKIAAEQERALEAIAIDAQITTNRISIKLAREARARVAKLIKEMG